MKKVLITGAAGFIGFHLSMRLLEEGHKVIGLDNLNEYYDIDLKKNRLELLKGYDCFSFKKMDILDKKSLDYMFEMECFDYVIHLAAQAGVRYSIENPYAYIDSNIVGFMNILEACRYYPIKHLIYASSSSVYGGNQEVPFSTEHKVDHPVSLYAATKKSNELMAHAYSHLYSIPTTGLRFFTVYGPYGRPDMAYFLFTKAIIEGEPIKVFNHGAMERDFTYIDDIVEGVSRILFFAPSGKSEYGNEKAPYNIYNIGSMSPVSLGRFINVLEEKIGVAAVKEYMDMQAGDVMKTYADVSDLEKVIGYKPSTTLEHGIDEFVEWYKKYYGV